MLENIRQARTPDLKWVIPSCETVLPTEARSDRALDMTREISERMREKYGLKT
jgi:hypothetical protein